MKKILSLALLFTLCLGLAADAETLRVGMECNYAPFNWTQTEPSEYAVPLSEGGFADGYDVQITRILARKLGMDLEIVKTEWDGLPVALTTGRIDAIIAGMSPTQERMLTIDFSDPYYESDLVIVVKKDGPYANARCLKDFAGAKITGQLNTFHYSVIDQIPGVIKQTALETFTAMIVALDSGRIDGYVSERPGARSALISNPGFTFVAFEDAQGFETLSSDTAVAVGLKKGSQLRGKINAILAEITQEQRLALMEEAMARQPLSE